MTDKMIISGRDDIKRDKASGAILACDRSKLLEAKRIKQEQDRYIKLEKRIQYLKFIYYIIYGI